MGMGSPLTLWGCKGGSMSTATMHIAEGLNKELYSTLLMGLGTSYDKTYAYDDEA